MAAIITTIQISSPQENHGATLWGNLIRDGWTCTKRGFKYGLTEVPTWDISSSEDADQDGDYNFQITSLEIYTIYFYQAYVDIEMLVGEEMVYDTIYGEWKSFYTNAEANVLTILATDATKTGSNESIKFIGYLEDNADGHVSERGFKYGLTEADTWSVSEAVGSEGSFNRIATGIAGDVDIYFRAFVTTPTGDYFGKYEKASTKIFNPTIFMLAHDLWTSIFYLIAYDRNGNIYNAWELEGGYWKANCICADGDGNTYAIKDQTTIIKRNKNGAIVNTKAVTNGYSITYHPGGYLCLRGRESDMQYLQRRDIDTLNTIGSGEILAWSTNPQAYTGLAIDKEGYYYVINRLTDKIEKWEWVQENQIQWGEFEPADVHLDTNIIDIPFGLETGAIIKFIASDTLPEPLEEDVYYWAIRISDTEIKVATSEANAIAGIYIDLTSQGIDTHYITNYDAIHKWEKIERDLSGVYSGNSSYLAIARELIYSNEYGEQGWTIPTTLTEDPTNWIPENDYVKSLSSLGWNKFIISGTMEDLQGISCYNSLKEFLWQNTSYYEMDYYSLTGMRNFEAELLNVKAVKSGGHLYLYGEITEIVTTIIERGFEYLVQDNEPNTEDTGTEVKEIGEFDIGEYHLYSWDTYNDLYRAEENKIWWFRAYCKDDEDNKYTAETWMKNVPSLTTFECTEVEAQEAKGNGELTDKGANIVTKRGFRIIKEYTGDLFGASQYIWDGFEGELEIESLYNQNGVLIGFIWTGILYRDSLSESAGYELGIYDKILGGGFLGEGFGLYLNPNDNYKVAAIGVNELGMGFGEEVDLETGQIILPSDDEIVSEISAEKTITLGTIPDGCTVTRIGIRLGRTEGCTDIHVYEDGSWGSGGSITFYITGFVPGATYYKMPYIILNHGDYEEEILAIPDYRNPEKLEEWLEDYPIEIFPEVEDEDDLDKIIIDASVGDISYRTIIKEIKCEKIGEQSFIDRYGRRRSQTINNHLIQSRENCKTVIDDYIERFQILKLKVAIDYDIPIPFEREDVILLGDGKLKYQEDAEGLIAFKADGEGEILQQDFILAKIRKIDSRFISGSEAILSLELEV